MYIGIPQALKSEHDELHAELVKATREAGETGKAAQRVAELLHPHFIQEEEFALPPLGLLTHLAAGTVTPEMESVLPMTNRLQKDLGTMLDEHKVILAALRELAAAASKEGKPELILFAERLTNHARTEEEVLYPAALIVGEMVRMKLGIPGG